MRGEGESNCAVIEHLYFYAICPLFLKKHIAKLIASYSVPNGRIYGTIVLRELFN